MFTFCLENNKKIIFLFEENLVAIQAVHNGMSKKKT